MATPNTTSYDSSSVGGYNQQPIGAEPTGGQVTGSSYATLAGSIFMIASMMTELGINYNRMSQEQTKEQNTFNDSLRSSTIREGKENRNQHITQAAVSGVSALASGASALIPMGMDEWSTEMDANGKPMGTLNEQRATAMNELNEAKVQQKAVADGAREAQQPNMQIGDVADASGFPPQDLGLEGVMEQERVGIFESTPQEAQDAAKGLGGDANAARKEIDRQVEEKQQTVNALNNRSSTRASNWRLAGDFIKEGSNAVGQGVQAHFVMEAAVWKSIGMAAQFNQQTSTQSAQMLQKEMSTFYGYASSIMQSLAQVAAASAG